MEEKRFVQFTQSRLAEVRYEPNLPIGRDQVLVTTTCSAISVGTELLVYRGELPEEMSLDATIKEYAQQKPRWPIRYGYAAVGQVSTIGQDVDPVWQKQPVFAFQPHASHFVVEPSQLIPIPKGISAENGAFLPNMETAVSFVMDARPMIGETVVVLGLGIVGQLTLQLLASMSPGKLIGVDPIPSRRTMALESGAHTVFDPADAELGSFMGGMGADLVLELSGNPKALDLAIKLTGDNGRVLVGSWYGTKRASLELGGAFHRSNIEIFASQVSRLRPMHSGRWDKARRLELAWEMIKRHQPAERLVTHRPDVNEAKAIYQMLDERPEEAMQVIFYY